MHAVQLIDFDMQRECGYTVFDSIRGGIFMCVNMRNHKQSLQHHNPASETVVAIIDTHPYTLRSGLCVSVVYTIRYRRE